MIYNIVVGNICMILHDIGVSALSPSCHSQCFHTSNVFTPCHIHISARGVKNITGVKTLEVCMCHMGLRVVTWMTCNVIYIYIYLSIPRLVIFLIQIFTASQLLYQHG